MTRSAPRFRCVACSVERVTRRGIEAHVARDHRELYHRFLHDHTAVAYTKIVPERTQRMSAWVVTTEHINTLIEAGLRRRYGPLRWEAPAELLTLVHNVVPDDSLGLEQGGWAPTGVLRHLDAASADVVGQILLSENVRSVNYRYQEQEDEPIYRYRAPAITAEPVSVLKAINCLDYQSCETPDWHQTEARRILDAIRDSMIAQLPGYSEAPWGIDDPVRVAR